MSVKKISQLDSVNSEELLNAKKVLIELAVPKNAGYKTVYGYLSEIVNGITKNITNNGLNGNITIGGEEYDEGFLTVQDGDVVFNPDLEQTKNHKFSLTFGEIIFSANGNNPGTITIIADGLMSINGNPVIINDNLSIQKTSLSSEKQLIIKNYSNSIKISNSSTDNGYKIVNLGTVKNLIGY